MEKIKNTFSWLNSFTQKHIFLILAAILFVNFIGKDIPIVYKHSGSAGNGVEGLSIRSQKIANYDMASDEMFVESNASFGTKIFTNSIAYAGEEIKQKLIKNASLALEVEDTEEVKSKIEKIITDFKGHITNLHSYEMRPNVLGYEFSLRIPAESLDEAIKEFALLGLKKNESFSVVDITKSYTDTANRITNLEARRDRLRELMEKKTDKLSDVLEIDRELSNVQNEIERLSATQMSRDFDISYSVLKLNVSPEPEIGDFVTPQWSAKKSWKMSINNLIGFTQKFIDKVICVLVFIPFWGVIVIAFVWWKISRKKHQHKPFHKPVE